MTKDDGQTTFDAVIGEAAERIDELHVPGLAVGVIDGANCMRPGSVGSAA